MHLRHILCWLPVCMLATDVLAAPPSTYQLVWQDEFKSHALDLTRWKAATNRRDSAQLTPDAVSVDDEGLHIRTYSANGQHYTGFLTTTGLYQPRYGYFEAKIRFQDAPGGHCAFWLQSPQMGKMIGDPQHAGVETDIMEHRLTDMKGKDISRLASFNLHWDGYGQYHQHAGGQWLAPQSLDGSWHTYALLWTADAYVFYVDDQERWRSSVAVSQTGQDIRLTCEIKDKGWAGSIPAGGYGDAQHSPYRMDVRWVRVWQAQD
jgi:beta-glucanase (GH16 family)